MKETGQRAPEDGLYKFAPLNIKGDRSATKGEKELNSDACGQETLIKLKDKKGKPMTLKESAEEAEKKWQENMGADESYLERSDRHLEVAKARAAALRENDYSEFESKDVSSLSQALQEKNFFEQSAILEQVIKSRKTSFNKILKLAKISNNQKIQLATIENLPNFQGKDRNESIKFLKKIALNPEDADVISFSKSDFDSPFEIGDSRSSEAEHAYVEKNYRYGWESYDSDYDIFVSAAIISLSQFGNEAENALIEIFKTKRQKNLDYWEDEEKISDSAGDADEDADAGEEFTEEEPYLYYDGKNFYDDDSWQGFAEPHESLVLQALSKVGTKKSIEFAVDFMRNDSDSAYDYRTEITMIFEEIDVNYSLKKLLPLLKDKNHYLRRRTAKILYCLEFGKIGISKEGVNYLGKIYDLKARNNPDYFVQRLNPDGDIGIFSEDKRLDSFFRINLESDQNVVSPQVMEFVYETLFIPKKNETAKEQQEREKILEYYKSNCYRLLDNEFHEKIGFRFNNLSFPAQAWFLEYSRTHKGIDSRIYNFARKYNEYGLRTFISLDVNRDMGDRILSIGESLENQPHIGQALFSEFTDIIENSDQVIEKVTQLYNDIFFEIKLDKNQIRETILRHGHDLLLRASQGLESASSEDKGDIVKKLIQDLREQDNARQKSLEELKQVATQLNTRYEELGTSLIGKKIQQEIDESLEQLSPELNPKAVEFIQGGIRKHKRYDSQRIRTIIEGLKMNYTLSDEDERIMRQVSGFSDAEINRLRERLEQEDRPKYEPAVKKYEELLKFQLAFEQKLESLIFGQEPARLPREFSQEIKQKIESYEPTLTEKDNAYWPVGVSSDPPKAEEIHARPIDSLLYLFWLQNQRQKSEFMVVDTIQETNYELLPEDKKPENPREAAMENGRRDKRWYRAAINIFDLNNVQMVNYQELENSQKTRQALQLVEKLERESPAIARAIEKTIEESIGRKVQKGEELTPEEREALKKYGKAEIAFVLAKGGKKIGHEKEYRFDIIARLMPIYQALKEHVTGVQKIVRSKDREQALIDLGLYLAYYQNYPKVFHLDAELAEVKQELNRQSQIKKSKRKTAFPEELTKLSQEINDLNRKSEELVTKIRMLEKQGDKRKVKDLNDNIRALNLSRGRPEQIISEWKKTAGFVLKKDWFKELKLPEFSYPIAASGFEGFREPYSIYKGEQFLEVLIEANQVIASTDMMAAAKLLIQDAKTQLRYFDRVLKPLLVNFYLATSESKTEATKKFIEDTKDVKTISDLIEIIQRKIIWPIEIELKQGEQKTAPET